MDNKGNYELARDSAKIPRKIPNAELRVPYRMIEAFSVENFRGFKRLSVGGLKTINVIVGRSGAGKTALLEALRLAVGASPTVAWGLNAQRALPLAIAINPSRQQFEAGWVPLFFGFNTESVIELSTRRL